MLTYHNLVILGTSHIAASSLNEIRHAFQTINPDVVAVELDQHRLYALLHNKKPNYSPLLIPQLGIKGYLFGVIGSFIQQKLGNIVGIKPGSDMLCAVELARDNHKHIALLDREVGVTLQRLSKAIGWREKLNFLADIFIAPFSKSLRINLKEVPEKELIRKLLGLLRRRYPGVYRVLVEERNKVMAFKLKALMENYPDKKILAVIGAGHEEDLLRRIQSRA